MAKPCNRLHLLPARRVIGLRRAGNFCDCGNLILLFTSFFAIPLARQCCLDAALFTGLQVIGMTLYFFDNVLLLYLPLKPAQRIF